MTPHEELRALLGKLPNPERAMELLEQVAAAPVVGELGREHGGFSGATDALISAIKALLSLDAEGALVPHGIGGHARTLLTECAYRISKMDAVPVVGEPVAYLHCLHTFDGQPSEELSFDPEEDAVFENCYSTKRSSVSVDALYIATTHSIPRARLDELMAAERRLGRVVALAKLVCESSGDNSRSIATVALKMELDVIAALCASKADDCGTSELDLIGGES